MAIFNATLVSGTKENGTWKAFCEAKADLNSPAAASWREGSVVVCLNKSGDKKPTVHVKLPDETWNEVAE